MAAPVSRSIINGANITVIQHHREGMNHGASSALKELTEHSAVGALHNSKERYDPPKCHPETRTEILQTIVDWTQPNEPKMMWLYGSAGAGKSAIAQSTSEKLASCDRLAASFFFSRTSSGSHRDNEERFVCTIALQLAKSIPGFAPYLEEAIIKTPFVWGLSLVTQAYFLVLEPLRQLKDRANPVVYPSVIIVDGLDECRRDNSGREQVLEVLRLFSVETSEACPFRVLVASRPEYDIQAWFQPMLETSDDDDKQLVTLDLDSFSGDVDIRRFFKDKTAQIARSHPLRRRIPPGWPSDTLIEEMVQRASGHFSYAATLIRYIKSLRHIPNKRLEHILDQTSTKTDQPFGDLDRLYLEIFRNAGQIDLIRRLLALNVVFSEAPSTSSQNIPHEWDIAALLSLPSLELDVVFMDLGSVIKFPPDKSDGLEHGFPFAFYHASLSDFLQDSSRAQELFVDLQSWRETYALEALQKVYVLLVETQDRQHVRQWGLEWLWNMFWRLCGHEPLRPAIQTKLNYWNDLQVITIEHAANILSFRSAEFVVPTPIANTRAKLKRPFGIAGSGQYLHPACACILQDRFCAILQSKLRAYLDCPDLPPELIALAALGLTTMDPLSLVDDEGTKSPSLDNVFSQMRQQFEEKIQCYPHRAEMFNPFFSNENQARNTGWTHILQVVYYWEIPGLQSFPPKTFAKASVFLLKYIIEDVTSMLQVPLEVPPADHVDEAVCTCKESTRPSTNVLVALGMLVVVLSHSSLSSDVVALLEESRILDKAIDECDNYTRPLHHEACAHAGIVIIRWLQAYQEIYHEIFGNFTKDSDGIVTRYGGITRQDVEEMQFGELARRTGLVDKYDQTGTELLEIWTLDSFMFCWYHL